MRALLALCAIAWLLGSAHAEPGFVAVKNAKNPTAKLSSADVKAVFSGRTKTWSNGEPVVLVIGTEDSPAMQWLASAVFGLSAKTLLTKIKQDVFHGDMLHPLSADDDAKTVQRVQSGAGVIGLVTEAGGRALPAGVALLPIQ